MTPAREAALEELFAVAPQAFASKRDALARRLAKDGDAEGAASIKARRKPTTLAYVLNQLARKHPEDLAELVDIGRELARAHRGTLRGGRGPDLREAIGRQRSAINRLTAKTSSLMKGLGIEPAGHLEAIASALQAALVDPSVGAALEEGRFESAPGAPNGFPEVAVAARAIDRVTARAQAKAEEQEARAAEKARRNAETLELRAEEAERVAERVAAEASAKEEAARALAAKSDELAAEAARLAAAHARVVAESKKLAREARAAVTAASQARAASLSAAADAAKTRRAAARAKQA